MEAQAGHYTPTRVSCHDPFNLHLLCWAAALTQLL